MPPSFGTGIAGCKLGPDALYSSRQALLMDPNKDTPTHALSPVESVCCCAICNGDYITFNLMPHNNHSRPAAAMAWGV